MTTLLMVDTASPTFAVVLTRDGRVLASAAHPDPQDHSRALLSSIRDVQREAAAEPDMLGAVVGPGSYAGLRVGIATIQGMAIALGLPVVAVGTLDAVAAAAGTPGGTAVHPVGRGEFAAAEFRNGRISGRVALAALSEIAALPGVAGEGAAAAGGREVEPLDRCLAAATLALGRQRRDGADLDAVYIKEPSITRPRRTPLTAAAGE